MNTDVKVTFIVLYCFGKKKFQISIPAGRIPDERKNIRFTF